MNLPAGLLACLAQCFDKAAVIGLICEDGLAAVATVHYVVDRSGYCTRSFRAIAAPAPLLKFVHVVIVFQPPGVIIRVSDWIRRAPEFVAISPVK